MLTIFGFLFNLDDLSIPVPLLTSVPLHFLLSFPVLPFKRRPDSYRLPFSGYWSQGRVQLWEVLAGAWRAEGREKLWSFFPSLDTRVFIQHGCFSSSCLAPTQDPCYPSFYQVMLGFGLCPSSFVIGSNSCQLLVVSGLLHSLLFGTSALLSAL